MKERSVFYEFWMTIVKNPLSVLFVILFILSFVCFVYNYKQTERIENVAITNILTQQEVSGVDGSVVTDYRYYVITDKGTFEITTGGIFGSPTAFSRIKVGDTLTIHTRGFNVPIMHVYSYIVGVE